MTAEAGVPQRANSGIEGMSWLDPVLDQLKGLSQQDRLPHALLLSGNRLTLNLAQSLARYLLCTSDKPACGRCQPCGWVGAGSHPDLVTVIPESKSGQILIDQTRGLARNATLTASGQRVFIIHPADAMNSAAANSLLKTLEEPPPNTLLVLCTARRSRLPATILSRCQTVLIPEPSHAELAEFLQRSMPELDQAEAARIVTLANGRVDDALGLGLLDKLPDGAGIEQDIASLRCGQTLVSDLAAGWISSELCELKLRQLAHFARDRLAGGLLEAASANDDLTNLWRLYDATNRCRALLQTSARSELQLEALLLAWRDSVALRGS